MKAQLSIISFFLLLTLGCNNSNTSANFEQQFKDTEKQFSVGDCFSFRDSIPQFGLILIKNNTYDSLGLYSLTPVMLDTTKQDLEQFIHGKIYIGHYEDLTSNTPHTIQGFHCFEYLSKNDFDAVIKILVKKGHISVKRDFIHVTGGTIANNLSDFKRTLPIFGQGLAFYALLSPVTDIIEKK